jgi:hypothetical protein
MSSPASRRRQRQRRRARERLWEAQKILVAHEVDLVAYQRVIVDMTTKRQLSPFGGESALALVTICRDVTRSDCERLRQVVADLERAVKDLEPLPAATV